MSLLQAEELLDCDKVFLLSAKVEWVSLKIFPLLDHLLFVPGAPTDADGYWFNSTGAWV